ncbi:MAG: LysR family transcriptional regulator [Lachnospiraceae bacterium]|nr:LysR family transcriptional regulator [Lachnospiraceae bacterium]
MELTQLKYFLTVAEMGKMSAASEKLHVSVSALSTSISLLERELGAPLFDRVKNRIVLNSRGQYFMRRVRQVLSLMDQAEESVRYGNMKKRRPVSYAAFTPGIWGELMTSFTRENPFFVLAARSTLPGEPQTETMPASPATFLFAEKGDLSLNERAKMNFIPLVEEQPVAILPAGHPLAERESISIRDVRHSALFFPAEGSSLWNRYKANLESWGISHALFHDKHEDRILYDYAARGEGIAFTSDLNQIAFYPGVCHVPLSDPHRPWIEGVFWMKDIRLNEDEEVFLDFVRKFYDRPPEKP